MTATSLMHQRIEEVAMPGKSPFDTQYSFALQRILAVPAMRNKRTGKNVKAIDGVFFRLSGVPILNLRDIKPLWTAAETVWFMGGRQDVAFMHRFGFKNWDKFTDKSGKVVESATGHRWRAAHGVDQLAEVIAKLDKDFSDRQAVLVSWKPDLDLVQPGPNAPCLIAWHLHVLNGELHMTVLQRSADMYFGLPHDILGARIIQEMVATAIGAQPGNLSYAISNAHLYEDQWDAAHEMILREENCAEAARYPSCMGLTAPIVADALDGDPDVVNKIMENIKAFYRPFPPLSGPRLVQ